MSCGCYCSLALPRGSVGWSEVYDRGISWSYFIVIEGPLVSFCETFLLCFVIFMRFCEVLRPGSCFYREYEGSANGLRCLLKLRKT